MNTGLLHSRRLCGMTGIEAMTDHGLNGDLEQLQSELMVMGGLVEAMLIESVDLLRRCDLDGLEQLGEAERQIREKRLAIEMGCLNLIASRRPKAEYLRKAVSMVEIASDLERIGEHAKKVARANSLTLEHHYRKAFMGIQRMAVAVQSMLSQALMGLDNGDSQAVERVFQDLPQTEDLYQRTYQDLLYAMDIRPRSANQAIFLSRAAYDLRRVSERVAAICEWVMFTLAGTMEETQRHHHELAVRDDLPQRDSVTV
jgi:phosphate transport system protein